MDVLFKEVEDYKWKAEGEAVDGGEDCGAGEGDFDVEELVLEDGVGEDCGIDGDEDV